VICVTILLDSERVLGITDGIENLSSVRWELFGTLILAWILVYFIIWKGLNESGYVSFQPKYFCFFKSMVVLNITNIFSEYMWCVAIEEKHINDDLYILHYNSIDCLVYCLISLRYSSGSSCSSSYTRRRRNWIAILHYSKMVNTFLKILMSTYSLKVHSHPV
jgi:hypothetical protein